MNLRRRSGEDGVNRQGGDVGCDWEGLTESRGRVLVDEWLDFWKTAGQRCQKDTQPQPKIILSKIKLNCITFSIVKIHCNKGQIQ